jgi:hypothetical protein
MKSRVAGFAAFLILTANAQACSVSGTAFTSHGRKVPGAVVRLTDLDASQSPAFAVADGNAMFAFDGAASGQRMRLDLLSAPTVVTGSLLATRSIVGHSEIFACANAQMVQDLQAEVD